MHSVNGFEYLQANLSMSIYFIKNILYIYNIALIDYVYTTSDLITLIVIG